MNHPSKLAWLRELRGDLPPRRGDAPRLIRPKPNQRSYFRPALVRARVFRGDAPPSASRAPTPRAPIEDSPPERDRTRRPTEWAALARLSALESGRG